MPKIFATLRGWYKLEANLMTDHTEQANGHWKTSALLFHRDDKRHILPSDANCALEGCLW